MADKQIKDYAITPLADTDSLVKQSVTGLTARTTLTDIKGNLDARYAKQGTVVWEDTPATSIDLDLPNGRVYEFWLITHPAGMIAPNGNAQIIKCYKNQVALVLAVYGYYSDVVNEYQYGELSVEETQPTNIIHSSAKIIKIIDLGEPV